MPTNSTRDGYGLGLAIVQRIVKLLGVRLDIKSEVGNGSTFSLLLPMGSGDLARTHAAPTPRASGNGAARARRVLLVEDEPAVRLATQLLLGMAGYWVIPVSSRAEALKHAENDDRLVDEASCFGNREDLQGRCATGRKAEQRHVALILAKGSRAMSASV